MTPKANCQRVMKKDVCRRGGHNRWKSQLNDLKKGNTRPKFISEGCKDEHVEAKGGIPLKNAPTRCTQEIWEKELQSSAHKKNLTGEDYFFIPSGRQEGQTNEKTPNWKKKNEKPTSCKRQPSQLRGGPDLSLVWGVGIRGEPRVANRRQRISRCNFCVTWRLAVRQVGKEKNGGKEDGELDPPCRAKKTVIRPAAGE